MTIGWRGGEGPPLVLLHSVLTSWRMWRPVLPELSVDHSVVAMDMLGHGGRSWPSQRPTTVEAMVDDVLRQLDDAALGTAHLAGSSLGGLVAMEVARRGRARSVTAFAPGGGGPVGDPRLPRVLRRTALQTRVARPLMPLTMRSAAVRRAAFRTAVEHGERMSLEQALEMADDVLATDLPAVRRLVDDAVRTAVVPYGDPGIPVHIAWPEHDRDTPFESYGQAWERLAPTATRSTVADAGHLPVVDAPAEVVRTIRRTVGRG